MPAPAIAPASRRPSPFRRVLRSAVTVVLTVAAGTAPLLGNVQPADAATPLVVDGFDRTVAAGWGKPDTGSAWTGVVGGRGTSVSGSQGRVSKLAGGRSFRAYQGGVSLRDAVVRADFTVPVAKNLQYAVEGRKQADGSSYAARARIDATGVANLDLYRTNAAGTQTSLKVTRIAVPVPVGQQLVLQLSTTGTAPVVVRAKLYAKSATEPGWQLTALDGAGALTRRGFVGVSAYNGGGNPAVDLTTQAFTAHDVTADVPSRTPDNSPLPTTPLRVPHGAGPVGSARYPVPANALFVAPNGSDSNPGTKARPFRTVGKAVNRTWPGQTIVLRAGTYHESVLVPPGHAATIQPYPGEAVWFDGTRAVSGFRARGSAFVAPWSVAFDASPTYTKGAPDGTTPGWRWINPAYPMAAHPDMVWLAGVEQRQVKSLALVRPGTFFVDTRAAKLYLGSNPAGKSVRAAALQSAFSLRAPGTVLRGFGIRRYAASVWQQGVVTSYFERMTLDNLTVRDSATGGIGFFRPGSVIKNTTVAGSGQVGIHANQADGLVLDNVSVLDSNDEHFNPAPSAGGIKVTQTRGLTLRGSEIRRTDGNQFWADQSDYDVTLVSNEIIGGSRYGIVLEISSVATVANNIVADNANDGVLVANTDKVAIWNNTIVRNRRAVAFTQDSRRITQPGVSGHDLRRKQPDLAMPWVIGNSSVGNNVLAAGSRAPSVFSVESYEHAFDASALGITTNGNVYAQTALGAPATAAVWARRGAQPLQFVLLEDFRDNTGQERASLNPLTRTPVDGAFRLRPSITARTATVAQPLPAGVAVKSGGAAGSRSLGAATRPTS